jgi:hypothetical protein
VNANGLVFTVDLEKRYFVVFTVVDLEKSKQMNNWQNRYIN